jgi:Spy/CpxP family protein refolding chaperone
MFGFLLGTACLVGLFWVIRGPRGHHCHGGRSERGRHWHHEGEGRGGFGRGAFMRWLYERLDTTPGQERVMRAVMDDFVDQAHSARREVEASRSDVARALRSESFDAEALGEAFAKHDSALSGLRNAAVEGLGKVHEALDDRQRARLAELIEAGMGRRWRGPYRSWS